MPSKSKQSEGATSVALVGASMGGTASLVAAGQEGTEVAVALTDGEGTSVDLGPGGELVVRRDDGRLARLVAAGPR